jgi:hypothetical protein
VSDLRESNPPAHIVAPNANDNAATEVDRITSTASNGSSKTVATSTTPAIGNQSAMAARPGRSARPRNNTSPTARDATYNAVAPPNSSAVPADPDDISAKLTIVTRVSGQPRHL